MGRREQVMKKHTVIFICSLFIFILFFTIIPLPNASAKSIYPKVEFKLLNYEAIAHVGPGDSCIAEFSGQVYVECWYGMSGKIFLNSQSSWGSSKVIPDTIKFSEENQGYFNFKVTVKAPYYCNPNGFGLVQIDGRYLLDSPTEILGHCEPREGLEGKVKIAQFHKIQTNYRESYKMVEPGERSEFQLQIQNQGNGNATFMVDVTNLGDLEQKGVKVSPHSATFELEPIDEKIINFNVTAPNEFPMGQYYGVKIEIRTEESIDEGGKVVNEVLRIQVGDPYQYLFFSYILCAITIFVLFILITIFYARWRLKKKKYVKKW
jgi:hypothetical protein